jgi:hypothetical protein
MGLRPIYEAHQFVIGGMKLDDIDPASKAIVRAKFRQMAVCLPREILHLLAADVAPRKICVK